MLLLRFLFFEELQLLLLSSLSLGEPDADADGDDDDGNNCGSSFSNKSGSLRNRKYTQSKWTFSSIAASNNASGPLSGVPEE